MKKTYEIIMKRVEVSCITHKQSDLFAGMCFTDPYDRDVEPEVQEVFESLEDAQEAFLDYKAYITRMSGYWLIEEYAIEECHYDEDGERLCDSGDGDYSETRTITFDVYATDEEDDPTGERLGRFDSYAEAKAWAQKHDSDDLRLEVIF